MAISAFYGLEGGCITWNGMRCYPTDQTRFGSLLLGEYAAHHGFGDRQATHVITLMDVWVMLPAISQLKDLRMSCWTPVDHDPLPPLVGQFLEQSGARPIAMSRFGQRMLNDAGFDTLYVPHGIETSVFRPQPELKDQFRAALNIPEDAFVVGMVANNQGLPSRKAFPQVFQAFKDFHKRHKDAILYVHADVVGRNGGVNLLELARIVGLDPDRMRTSDQLQLHLGIPADNINSLYNTFDVLCMPSLGEGFGIPLVEAQACGVPVITTDWTAMTELCGAGWLVDGERFYDATQGSFFKMPYVSEITDAMETAYKEAAGLKDKAREFALKYDADTVFEKYWLPVLDEILKPREIAPLRLAA